MSKRHIVFERPEGSKCWTLAFTMHDRPMIYPNAELAEGGASFIRKTKGWRNGIPNQTPMTACIVEVELPT